MAIIAALASSPGAGLAADKELCWDLGGAYPFSFDALIESVSKIYVARVDYVDIEEVDLEGLCSLGPNAKVRFRIEETLAGPNDETVEIQARFALAELPPPLVPDGLTAHDPDVLHSNPSFWELYSGRQFDASTATPIEQGARYLLLLDEDNNVRNITQPNGLGYQRINSDDDPWLKAVRRLAGAPAETFGRRMALIDYFSQLESVFLIVADSCRGVALQHTDPALGRALRFEEIDHRQLRRREDCRTDDIFLALAYPPIDPSRNESPPQKMLRVVDGFVDLSELNSQIDISAPPQIPLDRLMAQLRSR
ncbi:MAG: hypothetical protein Tsb0010_16510 [Parvularculaceae bacterium]